MKGQNSPVGESMAINPVNLGPLLTAAVNNLWSFLALVFRFCSLPTTNTTPSCNLKLQEEAAPQVRPQTTSSCNPPSTCIGKEEEEEGVLTRGNSSKQLFTVRLHQEEDTGAPSVDDHDHDDDGHDDEMDGGDEAIVKRWGRAATTLTVEMRRAGDLGWYGFQDIRVIDGSVVRLWDDVVKQSRGSPPAYPRRCSSFGIHNSC